MVYLQQHPCVDCGEKDVVVLDFDHVVDNKVMEVSKLVNQYLWDMVEIEIAKCVVRCSNCHRRKTAKEQSWWRLQ